MLQILSPPPQHKCIFDRVVTIQWTGSNSSTIIEVSWDGEDRNYVTIERVSSGTTFDWKVRGVASNRATLRIKTINGQSSPPIDIIIQPDYAAVDHTHSYAAVDHTHSYAAVDHTHSYAAVDHAHSYAAADHTHSYVATDHSHTSIDHDFTINAIDDWCAGSAGQAQAFLHIGAYELRYVHDYYEGGPSLTLYYNGKAVRSLASADHWNHQS